ncbi:Prefoldin beta-like protein [Pholiota conissans]|uniref:Prefoldin beta-like protein n=1 Tax=Pholiota conissans TaxID=109636 RepID=A0A9P5Z7Y7_9AGAR|nr:Prefoldin beta-like protein [Pholiota conissans]
MSSAAAKAKAKAPALTDQEIQQTYIRLQNELQALARKIGELESEADEHSLVLVTLDEALAEDPDRKCFRLIGGVLVERTVKEVNPALKTNRDGILKVIATLAEQYKTKEKDQEAFKREYSIRPVPVQ